MLNKTMAVVDEDNNSALDQEGGAEVTYRVDPTVCEAYGICTEVAGDIFDTDEWGYAQIAKIGQLTASERACAEKAFLECPVKAIKRLHSNIVRS